jgi:hypothetical protein
VKPFFTVANYLTPHSDLVALMVLEHQSEAHNRLVQANLLTRLALVEQADWNKALNRQGSEFHPWVPGERVFIKIGMPTLRRHTPVGVTPQGPESCQARSNTKYHADDAPQSVAQAPSC